MAKSKSQIRDVGGKRALFSSELAKLWDIGAKDGVATIRENRLLTASDKEEDITFYADLRHAGSCNVRQRQDLFAKKLFLLHRCCCSAYLSSCHRTASDANLLDDLHIFHYQDYFVIAGICNCLGASDDPMFWWISLKAVNHPAKSGGLQ